MAAPKFDPKEMNVVGQVPGMGGVLPKYDFPVSMRDCMVGALTKNPVWQPTFMEERFFCPRCNPDNVARAFIFDGGAFDNVKEGGGKDMFGIDWEYIAQVGGSMVRPGNPFMEDANEWVDKVVWPDIDSWDWAGQAERSKQYLDTDAFVVCWFLNGWYERLISFMEFDGAIVSLIDEDQQDAVKAFFDKLSDFYIRLLGKYIEYFPRIDAFCMHDDWGSQKETFFSPATCEEMIVPYMKKVTDFLHSKGKFCELHSCGQIFKQVPNIIKAGWDMWNGQPMNDTHKIYELYGDKLVVGVNLEDLNPAGKSEDEQRELAREYARRYCQPDKPSMLNFNAVFGLPAAFREELYIASRKAYSGEKV